jgi:hypothetical protein
MGEFCCFLDKFQEKNVKRRGKKGKTLFICHCSFSFFMLYLTYGC